MQTAEYAEQLPLHYFPRIRSGSAMALSALIGSAISEVWLPRKRNTGFVRGSVRFPVCFPRIQDHLFARARCSRIVCGLSDAPLQPWISCRDCPPRSEVRIFQITIAVWGTFLGDFSMLLGIGAPLVVPGRRTWKQTWKLWLELLQSWTASCFHEINWTWHKLWRSRYTRFIQVFMWL